MTDYYKISLEVLSKILQEENYDHWATWMQEDLKFWENNKDVEHHLSAYGGMGSFNDVVIGSSDNEGIWKGQIFGHLQSVAYNLAKGDSFETILERILNQHRADEISGWRCRNCGDARLTDRDINLFIANYFIPTFFVEYIKDDKLNEVINLIKLIDSEEVVNKKYQIISLINQVDIILNTDNSWLWTCPKCGSSEVCAYRWKVSEDGSKLVESNDNLDIKS